MCIACVGLATVDPIQLSHAQPNHIQSNVLWHLIKSRSAGRIFCMCGCLCVGVYKASPWRREITPAPSRCAFLENFNKRSPPPQSRRKKGEEWRGKEKKWKEKKRKEVLYSLYMCIMHVCMFSHPHSIKSHPAKSHSTKPHSAKIRSVTDTLPPD